MKIYNESQVEQIIRDTVIATTQGMYGWLTSDRVFIVDITTKERIDNCEIDCDKAGVVLEEFIYPLLAEKGINFKSEIALNPITKLRKLL